MTIDIDAADNPANGDATEKVGAFVRRTAPQVLYELGSEDLLRLQDINFSKRVFRISFAFLKRADLIDRKENVRYWRDIHSIEGVGYRITSQWVARSLPLYQAWLEAQGIVPDDAPETSAPSLRRAARTGVRWRAMPVGVAQNALVRHLLSTLGEDTFGKDDWRKACAHFGDACAYCGATGKLVIDHAVPLNRTALGEHRLGNLVPSCNACNSKKGDLDHRTFLEDAPDRVTMIEAWMTACDYRPRSDDDTLRSFLALAHEEIGALANRWRDILANLPKPD